MKPKWKLRAQLLLALLFGAVLVSAQTPPSQRAVLQAFRDAVASAGGECGSWKAGGSASLMCIGLGLGLGGRPLHACLLQASSGALRSVIVHGWVGVVFVLLDRWGSGGSVAAH